MKTFQQFQEEVKTITEIKKRLIGAALLATPYVMKKVNDKFNPVGKAREKYQDKKATDYEKRTGTSKEDGYFR